MNDNIDGLNSDFNTDLPEKILGDLELENQLLTSQNEFPISIFPVEIQNLINNLNNTLGFPKDYTAATILVVISIAIGNKIQLHFKDSWIEKSTLYMILVGRTGDVKSPAMRFCLQPLLIADKESYETYIIAKKEYEKLSSDQKLKEPVPVFKQLLLSDSTPEAMIKAHYNNPRGIGLYVDEIASLFKNFGRYNNGSDEEIFLSIWSGNPYTKNRIIGEEIRIDNTKIDIIGTSQEGIIKDFLKGSILKNGFVDRLLFAIPSKYIDNKWNDNQLESKYSLWYTEFIRNIISYADSTSINLRFNSDAIAYLNNWQNNREKNFDFEYQRGITIKQENYTLRFSILLHVAKCLSCGSRVDDCIGIDIVKSAILLRNYFYANSIRAFELMNSNYYEQLTINQRNLYDLLKDEFTTAEAVKLSIEAGIMQKRSAMRFLNDNRLFKKIAHGKYEKLLV